MGKQILQTLICCCTCLQSNNVAGNPTFSSGSGYFQTNAGTAPEEGCTISACTPFSGVSDPYIF